MEHVWLDCLFNGLAYFLSLKTFESTVTMLAAVNGFYPASF